MAAFHWVDGLKALVHWDQLWAKCSVMSMGELYVYLMPWCRQFITYMMLLLFLISFFNDF